MRNWKTTAHGVLGLLSTLCGVAVVLIDSGIGGLSNLDWAVLIPAITANIGLILAADAAKPSP